MDPLLRNATGDIMSVVNTRRELFRAHAIIECARLALDSLAESPDKTTAVSDALAAANELIDGAAAALETLKRA